MNRKELVKKLGEHFGVRPKYMGAPSFAYQITTEEGQIFIIDREGKIKDLEGTEFELETLLNGEEETKGEELILSMDGHTGVTLRNLVNMIYSKQFLIKKAVGIDADIITKEFIEEITKEKPATLEEFKGVALKIEAEKIHGISFDFYNKTISFNFLKTFEDIEVAMQFAKALDESARKLKQSSPKPTETNNEKFTFRTFLIRLGFVGSEYKKARQLLLKNLTGNGAFR